MPVTFSANDASVLSILGLGIDTIGIGFNHLDKFQEKPSQENEFKGTSELSWIWLDLSLDKISDSDELRREEELNAIKLTESGKYDEALILFDQLVHQYPDHPSPLNNRAQLHRLMRNDQLALVDLKMACSLPQCNEYPVVMRNVYAQLGWVHFRNDQSNEAREWFQKSFDLGNEAASGMLERCNPYATLCNAMMCELMEKLYSS
jgi:tetratricopeptide (TPR) repeat protein